jgi:hypothetical protein
MGNKQSAPSTTSSNAEKTKRKADEVMSMTVAANRNQLVSHDQSFLEEFHGAAELEGMLETWQTVKEKADTIATATSNETKNHRGHVGPNPQSCEAVKSVLEMLKKEVTESLGKFHDFSAFQSELLELKQEHDCQHMEKDFLAHSFMIDVFMRTNVMCKKINETYKKTWKFATNWRH